MKIIKVLVDEMPSGCKRCNFCVAKMYCSLLEDRKTTVPDEPYKRRADCPLVYDFGDRETNALNKRIAELEAENEKMKKRVTELAWTDRPTVLFDLKARIAELERDFDMLFRAVIAANKQSRKNTQTQKFVYGKEGEE